MKALLTAITLLLATPAIAQTPTVGPNYSTETSIVTLVANPAAKAVLDADFPGLTTHPMYEMFKNLTLVELAPMSEGKITQERLAKANADLAKLK